MKKSIVACVLAAALVSSTQASASLSAFLVIQGPKGKLTGGVIQKGREGWIEVIESEHRVTSTPAGARTHGTYTITKEMDVSSPKLYSAMINNDVLDITLNYFQPNRLGTAGGAGVETLTYVVKLSKARIVDIKFKQPNSKEAATQRLAEYEEIGFTYQDISWTYTIGGVTAQDTKKN